ncbi:hypothetical protein Tco_1524003 [Tanacetum coccineum]
MNKRKKHFARLRAEEAGEELESEILKKQKLDENVEAEVDDDQEEAEMKKHMEIVPDDEVAINAIPLATKPPIIKLVKAKHRLTRPEEGYERALWGDLKVMFEPDVESENLHIFMLVEKRYPLTPATITEMLNKKLQAEYWNEMCYQLLKLITKQLKNPGNV